MHVLTNFKAYGENAATFLTFQALASSPGALLDVFIANLKQFGTGRVRKWDASDADVWLFPNFGKGRGFGEPDALVLAGKYVFWVEIESTINLKTRSSVLRKPLLQLWRFRLFQAAISTSMQTQRGGLRVVANTLNDKGQERRAELRVRGHRVLQRLHARLAEAGRYGNDQYVLFTVNRPTGQGGRGQGYAESLRDKADKLCLEHPKFPPLDVQRCWYAYWNGHLKTKFNHHVTPQHWRLEDCYVGSCAT